MIALQYFGLMLIQFAWFGLFFAAGYYGSRALRNLKARRAQKKLAN